MSDSEVSNQIANDEQFVDSQTAESGKKKSGRAVMTEQKLLNLEKARAARKANLEAKKYSKDKRGRAEERIEEEVKRRAREEAEKLADELIKKREQEKELAEYRAWKKAQAEEVNKEKKDADTPKSKKKAAPAKAKSKAPAKPRKKKVQSESESDYEEDEYVEDRRPARGGRARAAPRQAAPEEDWLAGVLD